jgi:hypothetical protein
MVLVVSVALVVLVVLVIACLLVSNSCNHF